MIGEIIQQKRKEAGLTQAQLADRLGVTPPAVNRWEKNLSFPDATLLAPLARILNTDINTLFSFYDTLSDIERESAVDEARITFLKSVEHEGLSFIDKVIKRTLQTVSFIKNLGICCTESTFFKNQQHHVNTSTELQHTMNVQ